MLFSNNPNKPVGIHAEPSNLAFMAHQLLLTFKQSKQNYGSIADLVKPYETNISTIAKTVGKLSRIQHNLTGEQFEQEIFIHTQPSHTTYH